MDKPVLAIDLDNCLSLYIDGLIKWYNLQFNSSLSIDEFTSLKFHEIWGGSSKEASETISKYHASEQFRSQLRPLQNAKDVLRSLKKFFTLAVITTRKLDLELATREWLDRHFFGIFDKLIMGEFQADDNVESSVPKIRSKQEMCESIEATILVDGELQAIKSCSTIESSFLFGSYPWNKVDSLPEGVQSVKNWKELQNKLNELASSLQVTPDENPGNGPKWTKYTEDLITISPKRPASFYGAVVTAKFMNLRQLRLQASETAISNAVQVAETFKLLGDATVSKIQTSYGVSRRKSGSFRVARIQILIERTPQLEQRLSIKT